MTEEFDSVEMVGLVRAVRVGVYIGDGFWQEMTEILPPIFFVAAREMTEFLPLISRTSLVQGGWGFASLS